MSWSLEFDAVEKTLAEWGIVNALRTVDSQGPDILTFDIDKAKVDDAPAFADGDEIILRKDAVVWYVGRRITNPRLGQPQLERHSFTFAGPWWYLENLIFQQEWKGSDAVGTITTARQSHLFLQQTILGAKQDTGEQMVEVGDWVRARMLAEFGAYKFQLGGDFPAVDAPIDEVTDITCAEAIRKCLRWAPDSVLWFDYTTSPPTLMCQRRAELDAFTLAMANAENHESLQITSRDDLVRPSVRFIYRQTTTIDGVPRDREYVDIAPGGATGLEFGALVGTFTFDGGSVTNSKTTIETATIDPTNVAWWKGRDPKLSNLHITNVTLKPGSVIVSPAPGPTKELVNGQIPDWMGVDVVETIVKAQVTVDVYDRDVSVTTVGAKLQAHATLDLSDEIKLTTAASGTYTDTSVESGAEPIPMGLAAQIYAAISELHWQGSISLVEREVSGVVGVGQVLNIEGGRAEWETMNALIQSATYDLESGRTTVAFGPSPFLGPGDLIQLASVNRTRFIRTPFAKRTEASGSSGSVSLGEKLAQKNSSSLVSAVTLQQFVPDAADPAAATKRITIDAGGTKPTVKLDDESSDTEILIAIADVLGLNVKFRETEVCVEGEDKLAMVLMSEPYDP